MKPPLTRSDSTGVNSRAPRRINTLFWLFMLSSFHPLGRSSDPNSSREVSRRKRLLVGAAALTVEGISIGSAGCSKGACGQSPEPTGYHCDFLLIQITSALAAYPSIPVIHVSLHSLFQVVHRPESQSFSLAAQEIL